MKRQLRELHNLFLAFDVDSENDVVFSITVQEFSKVIWCCMMGAPSP